MKHSRKVGISKAAKAARIRNFTIYRLKGMMGNLAQMRYEYRANPAWVQGIEGAMDSVHALIQQIREEATSLSSPKRELSPELKAAFVLHGLNQKMKDIFFQ